MRKALYKRAMAGLLILTSALALSACTGGAKGNGATTEVSGAAKDTEQVTDDADGGAEDAAALDKAMSDRELRSDEKPLSIVASFYTMYDFAKKIGGAHVTVTDMVPAGTEPHDWEPAASDIRNLEQADVFIYSGAGLEHWAADVLGSLDNQELLTVEVSKGVALLEGDGHAHEDDADETEKASALGKRAGETVSEETYDPHVWLDPMNAKIEMENIKNAFAEADPTHAADYEANYARYAAQLDALDKAYEAGLGVLAKKDIVVAHAAFGYLCNAYGLNQVAIEGLTPDSEPDPARMAEVIDFVRDNDVKVIFFEELISPKVTKTIAAETGAETQVLNPLEGLSDAEQKSGADYFSVMEENLQKLIAALS